MKTFFFTVARVSSNELCKTRGYTPVLALVTVKSQKLKGISANIVVLRNAYKKEWCWQVLSIVIHVHEVT